MKRYRNGGNNEYTYGCTTGQYNSNDWVIGRDHHVFYRGVDKMSDKNKTEACYNCGTIIYTEFNDFKVIEGTIYCKECSLKKEAE